MATRAEPLRPGPGRPAMTARYTHVAIALHWTIAALILFNLVTGLFHHSFPRGVMAIHISSGITVLALTVLRILWRLTHRPPPHPADMKPWEKGLAHLVHFLLYAAMLVMPLSGWAMISANPPAGSPGAAAAAAMKGEQPAPPKAAAAFAPSNRPSPPPPPKRKTMIWGVIPLPMIAPLQEMGREAAGVPAQRAKHEQIETVHGLGGYLLLGLFLLHVLGAAKHQWLDGHAEYARMGIGRPEELPAE